MLRVNEPWRSRVAHSEGQGSRGAIRGKERRRVLRLVPGELYIQPQYYKHIVTICDRYGGEDGRMGGWEDGRMGGV